eukprot:scaffold1518_cov331-Pavlova_lutheri.AAC.43
MKPKVYVAKVLTGCRVTGKESVSPIPKVPRTLRQKICRRNCRSEGGVQRVAKVSDSEAAVLHTWTVETSRRLAKTSLQLLSFPCSVSFLSDIPRLAAPPRTASSPLGLRLVSSASP